MDQPLRIGAGGESAGELCVNFGTLMDDFRFYNKVLSAPEISAIHSEGLTSDFLIASYTFDNVSNDSSGKNNHLTNMGDVVYTESFEAAFNGSNYFQIANTNGQFSPDNFTVAMWIKPVSRAGTYQSIATCRNGFNFTGWIIYINPTNDLEFWTGAGSDWSSTPNDLYQNFGNANEWVHLAFALSKSASTCAVYVNGTLKSTIVRTYVNNPDQPLRIGAGGDDGIFQVGDGTLMDDFRFYNRVLSAAEISSLYPENTPAPPATEVTIYNAANFEGDFIILPPGDYGDNFLASNGFNDNINSIRVPSGVQATVYDNQFSGTQATYTSDAAIVMNSISSIRVRII
jgi:hypothetical protein